MIIESRNQADTFHLRKYKAVAVHNQTIESRKLFEEAARGTSLSGGVLRTTKAPSPSTKASPSKKTKTTKSKNLEKRTWLLNPFGREDKVFLDYFVFNTLFYLKIFVILL